MGIFSLAHDTRRVKLEGDEVFPLHLLDQHTSSQSCIINFTFHYDHLLDVEKLRESLVQLLHTGDWRKLAGRLRINVRENIL
jgi:hypothetical protein